MKSSITFFLFFCSSNLIFAQLQLQNLQIENQINPIGIDIQQPRLSWQLVSDKRNIRQTAYEIEVSDNKNQVWSSGKIMSESSIFNEYKGSKLISNTRYEWKVRVWDNQGNTSDWAKGYFQTALMGVSDWKANWISSGLKNDTVNGIVPMFKKTFDVKKKIESATLFITSRGLYDAQINGKRISDAYLSPGWTSYNKHLQYQTFDVTSLLSQNKNTIGVLLGSGWYRTRLAWENQKNIYGIETALLFQLEIKYSDGSKETVSSDNSWKVKESDIVYSEIYNGEIQDARKEGINKISASETGWTNVTPVNYPLDNLIALENEPIRKHEIIKAVRLLKSPQGENIIDFGQNVVGWVKFKTKGKQGDKITLYHFEMLDKLGAPYFENLRGAKAQATYTLTGVEEETFEPHFTFFGFRYVKIEGIKNINLDNFTAVALYSDMKPTGSFECSNPMVNQLQKNIQWGQRGNFLDVPTDCPQRDERLGWTGDAEVFSRTAAYNFNVNQFFSKWLKDVTADQFDNGAVPFVIPNVLKMFSRSGEAGAAGWSDASIIIPYNVFVAYGDKRLLETQYPTMKKYLNYMINSSKNDLWNTGFQFGDWLSYRIDESKSASGSKSAITDNYLVAQCFFAYNTQIMLNTAKVLKRVDDMIQFEDLLERVKKAFQKEYMTSNGRLISETQTAYVLALQFDMLPDSLRPQAVERLVNNIKSYKYHLTTGFLGTPFLNPVLTRFGRNDIAYKLLLQDTYPSWLYPIKAHGATTIWERWDSMKPDSTFQDPSMTSFNHYAYGAVGDWMYRNIAGIDTREATGVGYKNIIIRPQIDSGLVSAKGSLQTNYGLVSSAWKIENGALKMEVEIPANTSATIYFPTKITASVFENGKKIEIDEDRSAKFGSGKYVFNMDFKML